MHIDYIPKLPPEGIDKYEAYYFDDPDYVNRKEIDHLKARFTKVGYKDVYKVDTGFKYKKAVGDKHIVSEVALTPSEAAWFGYKDMYTKALPLYIPTKEELKEDFGPIQDFLMKDLFSFANSTGYKSVRLNPMYKAYQGYWVVSEKEYTTKMYPTAREAAWAVYNRKRLIKLEISSYETKNRDQTKLVKAMDPVIVVRQAYRAVDLSWMKTWKSPCLT
jgi:hypothetical protein